MAELNSEPYDVVPYPGYVHNQTHPDRLAVIGTLLGMQPAQVRSCRVLELGCGEGANLLPMAASLPNSEFVGIDRTAYAIDKGKTMARSLGLKNISLQELDLLDLPPDFGEFDYIIAHGIYAWVPDQIKDKIMWICNSHLKPQGIAYVSYNAYPGGHIADMLRNMLLFHLREVREPKQRIRQSIAFLKFLAESQTKTSTYSAVLDEELKQTLESDPALLYHDRIGTINTPVYFFQFINHAAHHDLQFLAEADYFECQYHIYPPESVKLLERMANESVILKEQYLDFIKCRRFRQTLLCHSGLNFNLEASSRPIAEMYVASRAKPDVSKVDLSPGKVIQFVGARGARVSTDFPIAKAALDQLARLYPRPIAFAELLDRARQIAGHTTGVKEADEQEILLAILLRTYGAGLLELYPRGPDYVTEVSERPMASSLARLQIEHDSLVTNLRHICVEVQDEIGRQLLRLLDGTRDRRMLLADLASAVESAPDTASANKPSVHDVRKNLAAELEANLQKLAKLALLVR